MRTERALEAPAITTTYMDAEEEQSRLPASRNSSSETSRVIIGYLCAVNVATLAFLIYEVWQDFAQPATALVPPEWIISGIMFWIFAFATAAWPFAATLTLARRLGIRSALYYFACGAITGVVLTLVILLPAWQFPSEHDESFFRNWMELAPRFTVSGACGAVAFWYKAGRRIGLAQVQAPNPKG